MNIIARLDRGVYKPQMDHLIDHHNFKDIYLREVRQKSLKGGKEIVIDLLQYTLLVIRRISLFRKLDTIVAIGWIAFILKIFIKLGVIKYKRFIWMSLMLHNPKLFPLFRWLLRVTALKNEIYTVNADYDAILYSQKLGIDPAKIKVLPYGDWKDLVVLEPPVIHSEYYFAGGYTDRDYKSLIEAFKKIDQKLIIVGSHLNTDLDVSTPSNIQILKDIKREDFHSLVKGAKACILPLKQATGASGHMVLLNYMREGKAIISTNVPGIKEYVEKDKSAILIDNIIEELPGAIQKLENDPVLIFELGCGAIDYYKKNFGIEVLSRKLNAIIAA